MNGKQRPRGKKRGSVGSAKPHGEKSERGVNYTTIRGLFGHSWLECRFRFHFWFFDSIYLLSSSYSIIKKKKKKRRKREEGENKKKILLLDELIPKHDMLPWLGISSPQSIPVPYRLIPYVWFFTKSGDSPLLVITILLFIVASHGLSWFHVWFLSWCLSWQRLEKETERFSGSDRYSPEGNGESWSTPGSGGDRASTKRTRLNPIINRPVRHHHLLVPVPSPTNISIYIKPRQWTTPPMAALSSLTTRRAYLHRWFDCGWRWSCRSLSRSILVHTVIPFLFPSACIVDSPTRQTALYIVSSSSL